MFMGPDFLEVAFESNRISTAKSWSSRVPGGRKTPMALLLILPAPDPYKHGLFLDGAATEGMLGTGKAAATAGQVLTVTSVMASLCLSPVYDQPCFVLVFFLLVSVCFSFPPHLCSFFSLGSNSAASASPVGSG